MIYSDGYIVRFDNKEELLQSNFPISNFSNLYPYTIKDEDTLLSIANDLYGNTEFWYIISEFNNLEDCFELQTGEILYAPIMS
jgi:hypothetical protein